MKKAAVNIYFPLFLGFKLKTFWRLIAKFIPHLAPQ